MRTIFAKGLKLPTLALYAASALGAAACATQPVEATYSGPPSVTAVFFKDSVYGALPDVLTYASDSTKNKTVAPPPSYGTIRIEFDRPLAVDAKVAQKNNLSAGSYCSPASTTSIQLVDLGGSTPVPLAASVCYDPTGDIGHNPGFVIVPGDPTIAKGPFTCNAFYANGGDDNGNIFLPKHNYGVTIAAASIKDATGAAVSLPSSWTGGTYAFTTDGFSLMAYGFQDQTNGLYHWFYKGSPGFENGLLAVTSPVVCSTNSDTTKCTNPAYDTNLLFYFSEPIGSGDGDVTITRDDTGKTSNDGYAAIGNYSGDPRELAVAPGLFWESAGKYIITLPSTITATDGTAIAAADAKTYSFTTISAPAEVLAFAPAANGTGIAYNAVINLQYQEPVDPALVFATSTNFQVLKGGTAIPSTVKFIGGTDHQYIRITPTPPTAPPVSPTYALDPETTYTIKVTGLTVEPGTPNAGKPISDFTSSFTTASFHSTLVATSGTGTTNIDRTSTSQPTVLRNGVYVAFNNLPTAATITAENIKLNELNPDGQGGLTVVPLDTTQYSVTFSGGRAKVQTIGSYPLKYGQRYQIKISTAVTDSISGKNVKFEGCVATDCSDSLAFATTKFTPSITAPSADADKLIGKFKLNFNVGAKKAALDAQPATAYQIFKQKLDTDGVTFINDGSAIPATCAAIADGATSTVCQTAATLDFNTRYLVSVIFSAATPLQTADTITVGTTAVPTDTASNTFKGIRTSAFVTPCAP